MIPVTVVAWNKDHGQVWIGSLKVDTTKLIYSIKADENNIELLSGNRASNHLKENYHPSNEESRKLSIHILSMVVAKF